MEHSIARPRHAAPLNILTRIRRGFALVRQRRRLLDLSDHLLDDMGIDRQTALREAARPIWDVPCGWRR
ncbi:MAG: DUF1127 domain-containing protein [Rhodobacteraceae bacterium]|nr:DUF1127 domain-containing protein [Paracoccaceae bacterium]